MIAAMMRTDSRSTLGSLAPALVVALGHGSSWGAEPPAATGPGPAAASAIEAACERGDNESCYRAAEALNRAKATPEQQARQFRLRKLGCDRDHEDSCLGLATSYATGRGIERDVAVGRALKRASCERGYPKGCASWGMDLLMEEGATRDVPAAHAVCFAGPAEVRASWCNLLGATIDQGMAQGDLPFLARLYEHACSAKSGVGCSNYGAMLFRQGKRIKGLDLLRQKCADGLADACDMRKDLLEMVAMEERNGGGPLGTPPGPLHLRLLKRGLSYDPPDENWGTSVPTHPAGQVMTMWRWWRRGDQIEVSMFDRLPKGKAAVMVAMPELAARPLAKDAPITTASAVLGGRPCSHASFATGFMGRGDIFLLAVDDILYSLLVLQPEVFSERLLDRALAGFRIDRK